jgi:hypothetical protein
MCSGNGAPLRRQRPPHTGGVHEPQPVSAGFSRQILCAPEPDQAISPSGHQPISSGATSAGAQPATHVKGWCPSLSTAPHRSVASPRVVIAVHAVKSNRCAGSSA